MPVYNGEPFIREALDSLLAQTFTDFELIISDNASTDATKAICLEYAARDARVHYVRQPENRGALANFQFALDEAAGEYFMWAAADDVWDLEWIEYLLPIVEKHRCAAFGTVEQIDAKGDSMIVHPANYGEFDFKGPKWFRRLNFFLQPNVQGKANPIYSMFVKNSITSYQLSAFSKYRHAADVFFLYRYLGFLPDSDRHSCQAKKENSFRMCWRRSASKNAKVNNGQIERVNEISCN